MEPTVIVVPSKPGTLGTCAATANGKMAAIAAARRPLAAAPGNASRVVGDINFMIIILDGCNRTIMPLGGASSVSTRRYDALSLRDRLAQTIVIARSAYRTESD